MCSLLLLRFKKIWAPRDLLGVILMARERSQWWGCHSGFSLEAKLSEPREPQQEEATCCCFQVQRSAVKSAESLLFSRSSPEEMGMCINRNCNRLVLSV